MTSSSDWLLDMEETAFDLLAVSVTINTARASFLAKFPGQEHIFDSCLDRWSEENGQFGVGA